MCFFGGPWLTFCHQKSEASNWIMKPPKSGMNFLRKMKPEVSPFFCVENVGYLFLVLKNVGYLFFVLKNVG